MKGAETLSSRQNIINGTYCESSQSISVLVMMIAAGSELAS